MKKILLLVITSGFTVFFFWLFLLLYPFEVNLHYFVVKEGESASSVCKRLDEDGIVKSKIVALSALYLFNKAKDIKVGEYVFSGRVSTFDVLNKLLKGKVKLYRITVIEGSNLYDISKKVYPVCEETEFLQLVLSQEYAKSLGVNAPSLEGYLFADTYFFSKDAGCQRLISYMVKKTFEFFSDELKRRAKEMGMSIHEILTLASIIEKETSVKEEMPLISAVFHNRLKRGMKLQADPTVIYGLLPDFDGNLKKEDLLTPTPYNTYVIKGLPPTPICSPSKDAIEAALYPADVPYLFFVSKNDGTHVFSKTLKEHNYYVKIYQKKR